MECVLKDRKQKEEEEEATIPGPPENDLYALTYAAISKKKTKHKS